MPSSLLAPLQHDAITNKSAVTALPLVLALVVASAFANLATVPKHALLTTASAWLLLCTYTTLRTGTRSLLNGHPSQRLAWTAGGLFTLAKICERAVDGRGIWWAKVLLPALIHTLVRGGLFEQRTHSTESPTSFTKPGRSTTGNGSKITLAIATSSGIIAVYAHMGSITIVALGLSHAVFEALAFRTIECARSTARDQSQYSGSVVHSANGSLNRPSTPKRPSSEHWIPVLRDVSAAGFVFTIFATLSLENLRFGGLAYHQLIGELLGDGIPSVVYGIATVLCNMLMLATLIILITENGALLASFPILLAIVFCSAVPTLAISRLWFAALCLISVFSFLDEQDLLSSGSRMRLRYSKLLTLAALVSFVCLTIYYLQQPIRKATLDHADISDHSPTDIGAAPPIEPLKPLQYADARTHPVKSLSEAAQSGWDKKLKAQSQTLEAAVVEYRRRYGIPPPPHFDKWYEFAKRKDVQLIDEYDTIYHSLLPFWGLSPATIRARAREALGFVDNNLMGLLIRGGKAVLVDGGQEWLREAVVGMIEQFVGYLPDMDLAFNVHDEPRVVVPHDELARLIEIALSRNVPAAQSQEHPRNSFSGRPKGVNNGKRIAEVKTTRFNVFAHQPTWIPSRLSCSPNSPARAIEDNLANDNFTAYALGELGFIYNQTAFSDICNSPSFEKSHGFFDRPNAFNVVHDLFPVFSQSKMSSFQDITYPSPWYWYGKVSYDQNKDMDWSKKGNKLWWRGSTTGGFSRAGGWRRQHRQQFVAKVNSLENAKILSSSNAAATDEDPGSQWIVKEVSRPDFKEIMDVHFSHVGQCDPGDCDAQREFFHIVDPADQQDAWKYKYLLDLDGNAFSGRFYAFLASRSLPLKMAVFREWHEEWIKPWVHYIPLSLKADEALEAVRYFDAEEEGKALAASVAEAGREWANKALRNEDFEVWLFRLLLEYGRVVDDDREKIGYTGA